LAISDVGVVLKCSEKISTAALLRLVNSDIRQKPPTQGAYPRGDSAFAPGRNGIETHAFADCRDYRKAVSREGFPRQERPRSGRRRAPGPVIRRRRARMARAPGGRAEHARPRSGRGLRVVDVAQIDDERTPHDRGELVPGNGAEDAPFVSTTAASAPASASLIEAATSRPGRCSPAWSPAPGRSPLTSAPSAMRSARW